MDHLTVVTATGKSLFVSGDSRNRQHIVRREAVVTSTGTEVPRSRHTRQQLYLSLAGPVAK